MAQDKLGYTPGSRPKTVDPEAEQAKQLNREMEVDDLRVVLSTEEGMRVIQRIMDSCHVRKSTFTGNSQGHFLEGKRAVGNEILDIVIDHMPEKVHEVLTKPKQYK